MNRVKVNTRFETQQSGIPLSIGVCEIAFFNFLFQTMGEDIGVDAIGKEGYLCRYISRGEVKTEVSLQTILCL
jgi:hypothetical protein